MIESGQFKSLIQSFNNLNTYGKEKRRRKEKAPGGCH